MKVFLCALVTLFVFISLLIWKNEGIRVVTRYVYLNAPIKVEEEKSVIRVEPPSLEQLKKDLAGKSVTIEGEDHQFVGPEINYLTLISSKALLSDKIQSVDVQICADSTIVETRGTWRFLSHENVCGALRMYYDKKGEDWILRNIESITLKKMIIPNSKAPSSAHEVYKHR